MTKEKTKGKEEEEENGSDGVQGEWTACRGVKIMDTPNSYLREREKEKRRDKKIDRYIDRQLNKQIE